MTLGDLSIGDFFVFVEGIREYYRLPFLCQLLAYSGAVSSHRLIVRCYYRNNYDKLSYEHNERHRSVIKVTPCKICKDSASRQGGVEPCWCHTL